MGFNRRKAEMEIAFDIRETNQAISGLTLGKICAAGVVSLDVSCCQCARKGRYRVTRLIDRHGAGKSLLELKELLTADCSRKGQPDLYRQCGAYFPKLPPPA